MSNLMTELAAISPLLPLIVRITVVVALLIVAWIVISLPAYWLSGVLDQLLNRLSAALRLGYTYLFGRASDFFGSRGQPVEQFISTHAYVFQLADENDHLV